jgi:hypothetical protein
MDRRMATASQISNLGYAGKIDAQPCAQPDGPVYGFVLGGVGAARRLA